MLPGIGDTLPEPEEARAHGLFRLFRRLQLRFHRFKILIPPGLLPLADQGTQAGSGSFFSMRTVLESVRSALGTGFESAFGVTTVICSLLERG